MGRKRSAYFLVSLCGLIVSSGILLTTEFFLCEGCVTSNKYVQDASWQIQTRLQQIAPHFWTEKYITATFDISGLGNLMFQYASMVGIAHESNMVPVIPFYCKLNRIFQLNIPKWNSSRPGEKWAKILEHRAATFDPVLSSLHTTENVEVVGYLQSWMYFKNIKGRMRTEFTFKEQIQKRVKNFFAIEEYRLYGYVILRKLVRIGVHIRRGDMLREDRVQYGYTVADADYLDRAVKFYEQRFRGMDLIFVVCSDDLPWAKRNFHTSRNNVIFSEGNPDYFDLAILSHCDHMIITTGTFGWWAGFLTGGNVIYYKDFPRNNSRLGRSFSSHKKDYYLPGWMGLI